MKISARGSFLEFILASFFHSSPAFSGNKVQPLNDPFSHKFWARVLNPY